MELALVKLIVFLVKTRLKLIDALEIAFLDSDLIAGLHNIVHLDNLIKHIQFLQRLQKLAHIARIINLD
jgi:hypothetical protein